jgi:hypothetical protein
MQTIMRLNNWQDDPLSGGDPGEQLSGSHMSLELLQMWRLTHPRLPSAV